MAEQSPRETERRSWTIWVCPDCACTNMHSKTCGAYPGGTVYHGNRVEVVPHSDAEALARAVSASLTHGERSPLEAALTVYLSKHPWSDL